MNSEYEKNKDEMRAGIEKTKRGTVKVMKSMPGMTTTGAPPSSPKDFILPGVSGMIE